MDKYVYELSCDDCAEVIVGDKEISLSSEVHKALSSMSNNEILRPMEDWFTNIVNRVCANTGFQLLRPDGYFDCENAYWQEHSNREDKEMDEYPE